MATKYKRLVRHSLKPDEIREQEHVDELAQSLLAHLEARDGAVNAVHVHRAPSSAVQSIVSELLQDVLGFGQEVVVTAQSGFVTAARPDFLYRLGPGRGIVAEVERGGTTTNNHDLKDLWKAHLAPDAHHLFLIVPNANWRGTGLPREKPFPLVARRLAAFFGEPRREIDVQSVHIFGYGKTGEAGSVA